MGVKGNKGGAKGRSGRKSKAEELGVQDWFDKHLSSADRVAIVKNLIFIATGDDAKAAVSAASMLFGYSFGKPKERVEHSGENGGPVEIVVNHVIAKPEKN